MKNNAVAEYYPLEAALGFYTVISGREFNRYDMYDLSEYVLDQLKGIEMITYLFQAKIEEGKVKLPCDVVYLRSVTHALPYSTFHSLGFLALPDTNILVNGQNPQPLSNVLKAPSKTIFAGITMGPYVDYTYSDEHLQFNPLINGTVVDIVFDSVRMDCAGNIMVNKRIIFALAQYMNYIQVTRDYYAKKADANMQRLANEDYQRKAAQARVPSVVSNNQWNQLLEVLRSNNRKLCNLPVHFKS